VKAEDLIRAARVDCVREQRRLGWRGRLAQRAEQERLLTEYFERFNREAALYGAVFSQMYRDVFARAEFEAPK
jgi:hypothetical protein